MNLIFPWTASVPPAGHRLRGPRSGPRRKQNGREDKNLMHAVLVFTPVLFSARRWREVDAVLRAPVLKDELRSSSYFLS